MPVPSPLRATGTLDLRVRSLARPQAGTVHRAQLTVTGVSWEMAESQVAAGRWQPVGPLVVVLHNGPLTRAQRLWTAVLTVGDKGCLAERTALEVHGFRGLGVPDLETVHVLHPRASSVPRMSWLVVHESRRLRPADIIVHKGLAATGAGRAAIDSAAWQPHPRFAYAVLAAVVQQRIARVDELFGELRRAGQVRHAEHMRLALADIAGGAQALSEIDLAAVCRRHALCPPARQRIRDDARGRRRFLDAEWDLRDGTTLVLEVDGSHHMAVEHWQDDMRRERRVVVGRGRSTVLRCSAAELRLARADLVQDLLDAGVSPRHP